MINLIILVCILAVILTYPWIIILAAAILLGMYIMKEKPDSFDKLWGTARKEHNEPEPDLSAGVEEPDHKTVQQSYKEELDRGMKPGFENDPEWQEKAEKIRKHVEKNKQIAEEEVIENKSKIGYT